MTELMICLIVVISPIVFYVLNEKVDELVEMYENKETEETKEVD